RHRLPRLQGRLARLPSHLLVRHVARGRRRRIRRPRTRRRAKRRYRLNAQGRHRCGLAQKSRRRGRVTRPFFLTVTICARLTRPTRRSWRKQQEFVQYEFEPLRVLVACEFSGTVRKAFLEKGHDAWSCDLLPSEDGSNRHIRGDAREILNDGWDLLMV